MSIVITRKGGLKKQCIDKTARRRKLNAAEASLVGAAASPQNDLTPELCVVRRPLKELQTSVRQVRKTTTGQIERAVRSIKEFGFVSPVTIRDNSIVDGHIRVEAARLLGITKVPCIDISHLSENKARLLAISLNRLGETGEWDLPELKLELNELELAGFDLALTGFSPPELDIIRLDELEVKGERDGQVDIPDPPSNPVTQSGDLWIMGRHRLLCGDSLQASCFERLLQGQLATAVLTDAPYNVKITNNVSGLGKNKHGEFKMGSGEMSAEEFRGFLTASHQHCADHLIPGGVVYSFMDWRSVDVLIGAGRDAGLQLINMSVWYKGSGSMGAFLRSAHELVPVFCKGPAPAINNVKLGTHGRDRTNVWCYPGANKPGSSAAAALKDHPSPKNVEMCVDAILDVTNAGDIILDPFLGSGTTIVAAEKANRCAYGIELDPAYADVCVRRWQDLTGDEATHAETGLTFAEEAARQEQGSENEA